MSAPEEERDVAELARAAAAPFLDELYARLTVTLRDPDRMAIESALLKAFLGGMQAGSGETAEAVLEQRGQPRLGFYGAPMRPSTDEELPIPHLDPWAERYGTGAPSGSGSSRNDRK